MRHKLVSIILSAGQSNRMNLHKALLEFQGKTFLRHVIDAHRSVSLPVYVVLGHEHEKIEESIDLSDVQVLLNPDPSRGPLSSLQLALDETPESDAVIAHPVDHPLVQPATIQALANRFAETPDQILIPEFQGQKGHPVLFPSRFYADLQRAPLEEGARWVVHRHPESVGRVWVQDPGIARNINTPAQFEDLSGE